MNKNLLIASAVAAALGASAGAQAQVAACASPTYKLYVAGSSAAKASFQTALANDLFTTETSYSSSNGDFEAFCGPVKPGNGAGLTGGQYAVVFYRAEGGSVVGALPIANNKNIKFLDLTGTNCNTSLTPATTGTSATIGTTDGWGGCVTTHNVEMGVTDVEPTAFTVAAGNYPTAYSTAVFGPTVNNFGVLTTTPLFQQVFGIAVNTSGINGGATGQAINLSKETVTNILAGNYTDWSAVPSASGGQVSNVSAPITVINREAGSGTRTGASIYFLGQECTTLPLTLADNLATSVSPNTVDFYATSDELKAASTVPGSISYASIDNLEPNGTKYPNLTMASLSGVTPTNLAAASGQYDFWFEAQAVAGNQGSTGAAALYTWFTTSELINVATAPHAADILAIPNIGTNTPAVPIVASTVSGKTIYVNPFSRLNNSCNFPVEQN